MGMDLAQTPPPVVDLQLASVYLRAFQESRIESHTEFASALDRILVEWLLRMPQMATEAGFCEPLGLHDHNQRLDDLSWNSHCRSVERAKANWALLQSFSEGDLTQEERLTRRVVLWQLERMIEAEGFFYHNYPINQLFGATQELSALFTSLHPLKTLQDRQGFCMRLQAVEQQFGQIEEILTRQQERGFFPPRFAIAKVVQGLAQLNEIDIEQHPFYLRVAKEEEPFRTQVKELMEERVCPAYRKLQAFLEQYLSGLKTENGVWALPDGGAYYASLLKRYTSLDVTPEEVHQIGLAEVARLEKEIRERLAQLEIGGAEAPLGQLLQEFARDAQYYYPNTDEGRALCLKKFEEILSRSREELGPFFPLQPKSPVEVVRIPPYEEGGAPFAYYRRGNHARPGRFYANLSDMNSVPKFRMETLTLHEGEPGHHYQVGIQVELNTHPIRQLISVSAHEEGWALYVEKFAYEQGFYSTPADVVGHLQDELLRAVRLVVDTGIHRMRWTREEAIEYMERVIGHPRSSIESEVERYFVLPAQACAYKLGQLKILDLRREAMEQLGENFSLKQFHIEIIQEGTLPLSLLKRRFYPLVDEKNCM